MGNLKILKHQTSCNNAIANALTELKNEALKIQDKTANSLDLIYKELDLSNINTDETDQHILSMRCLDVLHQGFKFTFEYEKALTRLITGESRTKLAKQLIKFARQWMTFVMNKCEKGRGLSANWITPGINFYYCLKTFNTNLNLNFQNRFTIFEYCFRTSLRTSFRSR